jgi:hypothetical protein
MWPITPLVDALAINLLHFLRTGTVPLPREPQALLSQLQTAQHREAQPRAPVQAATLPEAPALCWDPSDERLRRLEDALARSGAAEDDPLLGPLLSDLLLAMRWPDLRRLLGLRQTLGSQMALPPLLRCGQEVRKKKVQAG